MANYKTYGQVLTRRVALSEGGIEKASSESESECLYPYRSVVNWSAVPWLAWLSRRRDRPDASAWMAIVHFLIEAVVALVYCALIGAMFHGWREVWRRWLEPRGMVNPLGGYPLMDIARVVVVFVIFVEVSQLLVHPLRQLLIHPRSVAVRFYESISSLSLRPTIFSRRIYAISRMASMDMKTELEKLPSSTEKNLKTDDENASFFRRVAGGFWTLFYYNGPDFARFHHSLPIERRTGTDGSIVEEMFENERLQPFRGWGHTWPGHFLPTDKFCHWSSFDVNGCIVTSENRAIIEPQLPDGWEWIEENWKLDMNGIETKSVDHQGWFYSLDFPWISFSPEKNNGIRKISDFVRRRRYIRKRRQKSDAAETANCMLREDELSSTDSLPCFTFLRFV